MTTVTDDTPSIDEYRRRKDLLVAALRSGEFEQGQGVLCSTEDKYCCLGVACELYRRETGDGEWQTDDTHDPSYPRTRKKFVSPHSAAVTNVLSARVQLWFGFRDSGGDFFHRGGEDIERHPALWKLNDSAGYDFDAIAEVIDQETPGLFLWSS